MAGGMDLGQGGKGGKKPLDTAINLVPFIDLMAVTISFLIMTAVWTQIGRLQVSNAGGAADTEQQDEKQTVPVTLQISDKELRLSVGGTADEPIAFTRDARGRLELTKLVTRLKDVRTQLPDQNAITLSTEDAVRYEDLVRVIDECIGAGLPNVSVQAAMG
ncbi:MAG TPA: biopolymer transporter ExbD [Myxococcaceae bacterium]|nr:biopolymer transporter ExbD [Myxococcaceae bacterium]